MSEAVILERAAAAPIVLLGESTTTPLTMPGNCACSPPSTAGAGRSSSASRCCRGARNRTWTAWVASELTERAFLKAVRWQETWGHDPALYLPVFRFARDHRIPMLALNVDRGLVGKVARDGWQAVPAGERQGIGDPAPPAPAYRRSLEAVFAEHGGQERSADGGRFERFTQAQATWDRAMAEAIAAGARPGRTVVGIVGRGHVEHGWGIPHQLADLGAPRPMVLLATGEAEACAAARDLADAVFVLPPVPGGGG